MARDQDHVMDVLLAHNASLASRDIDGASAVDIARRQAAKQCLRKVRHLQLMSKVDGHKMNGLERRKISQRIIRIPSGQKDRDSSDAEGSSPPPQSHNRGRPAAVKLYDNASEKSCTPRDSFHNDRLLNGDDHPHAGSTSWKSSNHDQHSVTSSTQSLHNTRQGIRIGANAKTRLKSCRSSTVSNVTALSTHSSPERLHNGQGTAKSRYFSTNGELYRKKNGSTTTGKHLGRSNSYVWENNLGSVSRAPSAAGTQLKAAPVSHGAGQLRRSRSRGSVTFIEADVNTPRMLPLRTSVYEIDADSHMDVAQVIVVQYSFLLF